MEKADLMVYADQMLTCTPCGIRKGTQMCSVGLIENACAAIKDGLFIKIGNREEVEKKYESEQHINAKCVLPPLVDSHTHLVFAGSRVSEYELKAKGAAYLDILAAGGGILSTVNATRKASDEELIELALHRLDRMLSHGTLLVEAKSGYGLSVEEELRILRIQKKLGSLHEAEIVSTLLGAHAIAQEYADRREYYVDAVCKEMIPVCAEEGLAEFVDVFCEKGAFTIEETRRIFEAALQYGLGLRVHSEQFNSLGGSVMAAKMGAKSSDHLLRLTEEDIKYISKTDMVCTFLPSSEFFMNIREYGNARLTIDSDTAVALATDFNAGSCLSESLPFAMSIAVVQMQLLCEEAIIAATVNPAFSLNRSESYGSIIEGRRADLLFIDCDNYREWLYHVGVNMVSGMMKAGRMIFRNN